MAARVELQVQVVYGLYVIGRSGSSCRKCKEFAALLARYPSLYPNLGVVARQNSVLSERNRAPLRASPTAARPRAPLPYRADLCADMMLVFCVAMMLVFCGGFTGGTTSVSSGRLLFANPNMHMIQRGIPRTLPQMGIVPSSLAAAALATSAPGPTVAALAASAPDPDPSSTIEFLEPLLSVFDPAMPAWLFLSSDPRFAFLTMLIGLVIGLSDLVCLTLNIQNKNRYEARDADLFEAERLLAEAEHSFDGLKGLQQSLKQSRVK